MARSKNASFLRGRRVRVTRLDRSGRPVYGDDSVVTSKGFVTAGYTTNTEEGTAISQPNAAGENCIQEAATPTFNGFGVEINFCEVDFALFSLLTGQEVFMDPETGEVIGLTESTDVDLSAVNFAFELWMGAQSSSVPHANSQGRYGYMVTPFLGGGVIGDVTVENAAITFTITGMQTKNGSGWGAGPYNVMLGATGQPSPMVSDPMGPNDHRRWFYTEVAPPEPHAGTRPLLSLDAEDVTALSVTSTGLTATITPTPAGDDPMWYDFGDGTWDYAETGSYDHTYTEPGEYTIIGYRGGSSATSTVTVTSDG